MHCPTLELTGCEDDRWFSYLENMQYFYNDVAYDFQQTPDPFGYANGMYFAQPAMPMESSMGVRAPMPSQIEMPQNTGFNEAPRILCEFPIGQITIRIRVGTVRHIFKKHWKDFVFAAGGARDWNDVERNVANYLKSMISNSTQLFVTDELTTRTDALLLYLRRPGDVMFHRIPIAQDHEEKHVYNICTAYKLRIEEQEFYGIWKNFSTQNEVFYQSGMNGIFTRTSDNPHLANIHRRPDPEPLETHFAHFVPVQPIPCILVPVQPIHYFPYPPPVHVW
ncbi:hypothetical protein CRE_16151 [Caenorhabditis remanei]|uniref:Uncharacterized protein n=1 Tax=Caenorhabditis remanei TaxID=31234 RepID=E3MSJ0_CAERE|nr:hypothetical protein CRE_16151 [Caenorhabditis remanei]